MARARNLIFILILQKFEHAAAASDGEAACHAAPYPDVFCPGALLFGPENVSIPQVQFSPSVLRKSFAGD
jgi:hypothetical protein